MKSKHRVRTPTHNKSARAIRMKGMPRTQASLDANSPWAWHRDTLQKVRDKLLAELGELQKAVKRPADETPFRLLMGPRESFEQQLTRAELSAKQDAIREVEEALLRISEGSYALGGEQTEPRIQVDMQSRHSVVEWDLRAS